jgi:hypothetical protein
MPATSDARIISNRQNSLRSTGPKTALGKSISRKNSLKHGLTGSGVVLAEEDASEVEVRAGALMAELDPKSTLGKVLVGQIATLSVRMERGARQEEEALASRVRHAAEAFDHDRVDLVEFLFNTIAEDPRGNLIELRRSPEGVDRLIEAWGEVRSLLMQPNRQHWNASLHAKATHLMGLRIDQAPGSRFDLLWASVQGKYNIPITDPEWAALDRIARIDWARDRLVERIDVEIASLKEHRATLNLEAIALDRAGAADLALFDPSSKASLARRYEADARRGFFKALKEFRQVESEAADRPDSMSPEVSEPAQVEKPLGSSCEGRSPTSREPKPTPRDGLAQLVERDFDVARGLGGRVVAIGRAVVVPG